MPFGYPVMLQLDGRRAVVIGEGAVRERKPEGLLAGGAAEVLVVATTPAAHLNELEALDRVRVERRLWRPEDLDGAAICVAWSSRSEVRAAIARAARDRGVWVNVMDDVANCDFAAPAVVRRGELILAIGTGGASPALARRLREELGEQFGEHWAEIVSVLREVRESTLPLLPDLAERSRRWRAALDLDEAEKLVLAGRSAELRERLRARLVGDEGPSGARRADGAETPHGRRPLRRTTDTGGGES
jgi:precorrin-2 dehydrogenase/sirohydrochlorin ferrochelatase